MTGPAGPEMRPFRSTKAGVSVSIWPSGETGCGASITTGSVIEKLAAAEYGPVLAPSRARDRQ